MSAPRVTKDEIQTWLQSYISKLLDTGTEEVGVHMELDRFGLNSAGVVSMIGELEEWLKVELSPSLLFEHTTIDAVAAHLHSLMASR
jgi:acyl carrier protein